MGAVLGVLAIALVGFFFWRRKKNREKAAKAQARVDAKVRAAAEEKFRPGRQPSEGTAEEEEDTEWTEMGGDGLVAVTGTAGEQADQLGDMMPPKRFSSGAATHLSRITEGVEEDEDELEELRSRTNSARSRSLTAEYNDGGRSSETPPMPSNQFDRTFRVYSTDSSIHLDPKDPRFQRGAGAAENPFSDSASIPPSEGSFRSSTSTNIIQIAYLPDGRSADNSPNSAQLPVTAGLQTPMTPQPMHPLSSRSDIQRGPQRQSAPDSATTFSSQGSGRSLIATPQPARPARSPELNLRLADGAEPGKLGSDLSRSASQKTASSYNGSDQYSLLSPAAPSTARSKQFDFMSVDPSTMPEYNSTLASSGVYSRSPDAAARHLSTTTTMTTSSTSTSGLDYVLSTPHIVTPVSSDGARRVQLNQGKAQLVRSLSAVRAEAKAKGLATPVGSDAGASPVGERADPFADSAAVRPASPSTTFGGPTAGSARVSVGGSTFADDSMRSQSRQSTKSYQSASSFGIPILDVSSNDGPGLRDPRDFSPADAHRSSWNTSGTHTRPASSASQLTMRTMGSMPGNGARQSNASSIGGLSVFDGIPFNFGQQVFDVPNAAATVAAAQAASKQADLKAHAEDGKEDEEDDSLVAPRRPLSGKASSFASGKDGSAPSTAASPRLPEAQSTLPSEEVEPESSATPVLIRTGAQASVEDMRLRHELENFPFQIANGEDSNEVIAREGHKNSLDDSPPREYL